MESYSEGMRQDYQKQNKAKIGRNFIENVLKSADKEFEEKYDLNAGVMISIE